MIVSIPSYKGVAVGVTPISARRIVAVWLEDKNGGVFRDVTDKPDTFSLCVDGVCVLDNVFCYPFFTHTNDRVNIDWRKVAIPMSLNVRNSEIRFTSSRSNDYLLCYEAFDDDSGNEWYTKIENTIQTLYSVSAPAQVRNDALAMLNYVPTSYFVLPFAVTQRKFAYGDEPNRKDYTLDIIASSGNRLLPELDASVLSVTDGRTWKDAAYVLDDVASKNIQTSIALSDAKVADYNNGTANKVGVMHFFISKQNK